MGGLASLWIVQLRKLSDHLGCPNQHARGCLAYILLCYYVYEGPGLSAARMPCGHVRSSAMAVPVCNGMRSLSSTLLTYLGAWFLFGDLSYVLNELFVVLSASYGSGQRVTRLQHCAAPLSLRSTCFQLLCASCRCLPCSFHVTCCAGTLYVAWFRARQLPAHLLASRAPQLVSIQCLPALAFTSPQQPKGLIGQGQTRSIAATHVAQLLQPPYHHQLKNSWAGRELYRHPTLATD